MNPPVNQTRSSYPHDCIDYYYYYIFTGGLKREVRRHIGRREAKSTGQSIVASTRSILQCGSLPLSLSLFLSFCLPACLSVCLSVSIVDVDVTWRLNFGLFLVALSWCFEAKKTPSTRLCSFVPCLTVMASIRLLALSVFFPSSRYILISYISMCLLWMFKLWVCGLI